MATVTGDRATNALDEAWVELVRSAGLDRATTSRDHADLVRRYREPHRAYHTLEHVAAVLAEVDRLVAAGAPSDDLWTVRAAAWFHDAVYDPGARDNERASALLAGAVLERWGVAPERRRRVEALVGLTANHVPDDAPDVPPADAALLADADLAVLAATSARYDTYARAIRREYGRLGDDAYARGRRAFLAALLARPRLFHTAAMAGAEAVARANVRRELDALAPARP
jgi:predicted metal-dependent HD superfamily phosphohydrolase